MSDLYLQSGQTLWYCDRKTGELGTVKVMYAYPGSFIIEYDNRLYRFPYSVLGTRLFFTRKAAACPSEILKGRETKEKLAKEGGDFQKLIKKYEDMGLLDGNPRPEKYDEDEYDYRQREFIQYCNDYYDYYYRDSGDFSETSFTQEY